MHDLFQARGLAVGYGGKAVIDGVELTVQPGRIVTLIGPNGAGKSTLLKTITRQLAPLAGTAFLDGKDLTLLKENALARTMAILMTDRPAPELMTCREVVAAGRYPYTGRFGVLTPADWQEVDAAMALVGVAALAERDFTRVSDGQRQLVLLARAICQRPRLLVLDEPTSFLDIRHKLLLLAVLKELANRERVAVLLSLHELDLAQKVSDTLVCVAGGRVERAGPPEEIFAGGYIERLYGVTDGSFNERFGTPELRPAAGAPRVFVIGGGGGGIDTYRRLQRQGVPFAAGVLHQNDLDLPVARALAAEVVTETAFEPIGEAALQQAQTLMARCGRVLCCVRDFGTMNAGNRALRDLARENGWLREADDGL